MGRNTTGIPVFSAVVTAGVALLTAVAAAGCATSFVDGDALTTTTAGPTTTELTNRQGLSASPATGLHDGDQVTISADPASESMPFELKQCLAPTAEYPAGHCADGDDPPVVDVGANGVLTEPFTVHRVITVGGVDYDCAARPKACVITAGLGLSDGGKPTAVISFATDLPPVDAEVPPEG